MTIPDQYSATGPHPEAASQEAAHIGAMTGAYPIYESTPTLEQIHRRLNAENIDLRGQLEMSRKATSTAQELLEAERQKNAALNDKLINAEGARTANTNSALEQIGRVKELRLLRTNDRAEMDDLQRRLREAEGQLKVQRDRMGAAHDGNLAWYQEQRTRLAAENTELRRTLGMVGKYLDELKELVNDPANPNGKP